MSNSTAGCDNGTRPSINGLEFNITCGSNMDISNLIDPTPADNLDDCMNRCAEFSEPCYAVEFNTTDNLCSLKPDLEQFPNFALTADTSTHIALANATQLQPIEDEFQPYCPEFDGFPFFSENGLQFEVTCSRNFAGEDIEVMENGRPGKMWTESLEMCMRQCSITRPLCNGVAWNPDLSLGYANCQFKSSLDTGEQLSTGAVVHTAAPILPLANNTCTEDFEYTFGDKTFLSKCSKTSSVRWIKAFHTDGLDRCVQLCAKDETCKAVAYEPDMRSGFSNCMIKNDLGEVAESDSLFIAALKGPNWQPGGASTGGVSAAKRGGIIAGSIIGVIAAILLVGAFFWWRRRRQQQQKQGNLEQAKLGSQSTELESGDDEFPTKVVELATNHSRVELAYYDKELPPVVSELRNSTDTSGSRRIPELDSVERKGSRTRLSGTSQSSREK